jgi:hypothetical protein
MRKFIDIASETVFGTLWTRPGLDLKTRTLVCVVSDAATARTEELAIHVRMALRHGWTEDELIEVLLHLLGYVGAPLVREAMITTWSSPRCQGADGARPILRAPGVSSTRRTSARRIAPPGVVLGLDGLQYSPIAASWLGLSLGAASSVRARIPATLAVAACARSIQRPSSFQSLSKKTTIGMERKPWLRKQSVMSRFWSRKNTRSSQPGIASQMRAISG